MAKVYPFGEATFTVPASSRIAILSDSPVKIYHRQTYPNYPAVFTLQATTEAGVQYTSSAFSAATEVRLDASEAIVTYQVGVSAVISDPVTDLQGTDDPFNLDGQDAAQGGAVTVTGGTSSTSANAGGAVNLTGGTPGATGVGGAVNVDGGAGGSTSGAGGAATIEGGDASAGNSAGGAVTINGGDGSGSSAGGAGSFVGGTGGATGSGGALTLTSGRGGATSGVSGDVTVASELTTAGSGSATGSVTVQSGAGAASAAAVAGGASGDVTVQTQDGGANTGGATGQVGGAAGDLAVTGGAGGATNSTGAHDGGAGGDVAVTAGAGGAASAGTGDGGAGGTVSLVNGAGGTSAGGTAGVPGMTKLGGTAGANAFALNVARNTISDAATLTDAEHRAQVIYQDASGGNVTCTTRTGAQLAAAFPDMAVGNAIALYHASNHATNTSTISGDTGCTLVGSGAVTATGGQYLLVKTAAATFDLVRVG